MWAYGLEKILFMLLVIEFLILPIVAFIIILCTFIVEGVKKERKIIPFLGKRI